MKLPDPFTDYYRFDQQALIGADPAPKLPPVRIHEIVDQLDPSYEYIQRRGIRPDVAKYLNFGFFHAASQLLFAVHDPYGNFVDFVLRVLDNSEPKYRFHTGFAKMSHLFNYHRAKALGRQAVVVVEGFFDTANLVQAGYPSVVALMGSTMSERQEQLLTRWWDHVIFMLDGDPAGRRMQQEALKRMKKHQLKGLYGVNLPDKVQPDSLTVTQIGEFIKTAQVA